MSLYKYENSYNLKIATSSACGRSVNSFSWNGLSWVTAQSVLRSLQLCVITKSGDTVHLNLSAGFCFVYFFICQCFLQQTLRYYFQRNRSIFQFLTHVELQKLMAAILEMPQYLTYHKIAT